MLTKDQSTLEIGDVSKDIKVFEKEEEELEEESMDPPLQRIDKQHKVEKPPLILIDFIISLYSISTSLFIYNYISLSGVGVKETFREEHADQRERNFMRSLECRRLLPL